MKFAIDVLQEELRGLEKAIPADCSDGPIGAQAIGTRRRAKMLTLVTELKSAIVYLQEVAGSEGQDVGIVLAELATDVFEVGKEKAEIQAMLKLLSTYMQKKNALLTERTTKLRTLLTYCVAEAQRFNMPELVATYTAELKLLEE